MRIVVLLPAPFVPSRPTISPRPTLNEMFDMAVCPAYRFVRFETSIIKQRGWSMRELTRNKFSLEDIYVRVTRTTEEEEG